MNLKYALAHDTNVIDDVEVAFGILAEKPRYNLPAPVKEFKRAKPWSSINHQRVDFWARVGDHKVAIRVEEFPVRPKKQAIKKLITNWQIPTLILYGKESMWSIVRKLAHCLRLGMEKIRRQPFILAQMKRIQKMELLTAGERKEIPAFVEPDENFAYN